jgi:hypothetical protein
LVGLSNRRPRKSQGPGNWSTRRSLLVKTPEKPPRQAFAPHPEGHHLGFRDATGVTYRAGLGVFWELAYEWDLPEGMVEGRRAARAFRTFGHEGDPNCESNQNVELAWVLVHDDLVNIPRYADVFSTETVAYMRTHPKAGVLSNWGVVRPALEEAVAQWFRSRACRAVPCAEQRLRGHRLAGQDVPQRKGTTIPSYEESGYELLGSTTIQFSNHKVPKPKHVVSFTPWEPGADIDSLVSEEHQHLIVVSEGPLPTPADDHSCHLQVCEQARTPMPVPPAAWLGSLLTPASAA